jgi:hypothetical protein
MTDPEKQSEDEALCRIVEEFIDGEPVASEALLNALAEPAAREHLIDLLVLRRAVGTMAPMAWTTGRHGTLHGRSGWLATAAAVLLSLALGYFAGQRALDTPIAAQTIEAVAQVEGAPAPPKPTRIIKLEPGVNWTESSGGR